MNLTVVGLSRGAEKRTKLKALGADFVFDSEDKNLPRSVSAAISPKKVHLAVDCVGGKLLSHVITMLGYGGRISIVGRSAGPVPEFNTATLLFRRIRMGGVSVGDHTAQTAQAAWRRLSTGWRPLDSVHRLTASSRSKKSRRDSHDWHRVRWGKYWYVWPAKS
jgi:NADPH:quinone reductase-like Zn-dependent oxidoreductase